MKSKSLMLVLAVAFSATVFAAPEPASDDGLVARRSSHFDQVRVAPAATAYRKIALAPVEVVMRQEKHGDANAIQRPTQVQSPDAINRTAQNMATSLEKSLVLAFRDAGYEPVSAAGPGVLVLKARITDLKINATESSSLSGAKAYVREAGEATLRLEGLDGVTGKPVVVVVDRAKPRSGVPGMARADEASVQFWFDDVFQSWSQDLTREVGQLGKSG